MPPKYKRKLISFKQKIIPRLPIIAGIVFFALIIKFITSGIGWLRILKDDPVTLLGSYKGKTNILLLGIAGGSHSGRDLTDTMIFVSADLKTADVLMVSLPRDIWSPTLQDKINSAYHYGETKKRGGGLVLAKSIAEEVLGQPIHYALMVDFEGFKNAVDIVGGLKINVKEPFIDKKFPIQGKEGDKCGGDPDFSCRYETISFKKGVQVMDGKTALKYIRSRNAKGRQGTDFARSKRQQQVLFAFREKATSLGILANPLKLNELYNQLGKTIKTDAQLPELLALAKAAAKFKGKPIRRISLENWLYNPPTFKFGRWVLYPITDSFDLIHDFIACSLASPSCNMKPEDYE